MAVYERGVAGHVAERVRPEPGSDAEARLQVLADNPASDWRRIDDPKPAEQVERSGPSRPAKSAAKGAWVEWAVAQGADRAEAEKATKDDLIAAYGGGQDDDPGPDPAGGGE
jgi:hypothetical protein